MAARSGSGGHEISLSTLSILGQRRPPPAFYPICQRYKLILISERAHAGFLGREGRAGFIGIRVTRCDVIVARSTGAPTINAIANRASEL